MRSGVTARKLDFIDHAPDVVFQREWGYENLEKVLWRQAWSLIA
jgi:hypothetical protein